MRNYRLKSLSDDHDHDVIAVLKFVLVLAIVDSFHFIGYDAV